MYDNRHDSPRWPLQFDRAAQDMAETALRTARQLLPFAGGDVGPLPLLSPGRTLTAPTTQPPASVSAAAADIVSQAAAILEQEMAKGIVAAQHAVAPVSSGTGMPAGDILQQLHALIENVARLWPTSGTNPFDPATGAATPRPAAAPLPELTPASPLRPGDQATITMTIRNHEDKPVSLTPAATPLLGSGGDRIAAQLLQFTPAQLQLDPGQQHELRITITIPARCGSGRYAGLLVVSGVDYLRALITVEVRV